MDRAGNLYGTTLGCCGIGYGTVFELTPSSGVWTERVIYSVNTTTYAGLTMDFAGNISGSGNDSVFLLSPDGSGGWNPTVIHTFPNRAKDGNAPEGTLVLDKAGNVYGTTSYGGAKNHGTVYRLTRRRNGKWTEQILYSFNGGTNDGSEPFAGIVLDATGNIYGTTVGGGKSGDGVVFELVAPAGKGGYKQKILWSFDGPDGQEPVDSLILNSAGKLYGTTYFGGQSDSGVVFEVTR